MISEWRDKNADRRKSHFVYLVDVAGAACAGGGWWLVLQHDGWARVRSSVLRVTGVDGESTASKTHRTVYFDLYG